jgi:hypothetical protein
MKKIFNIFLLILSLAFFLSTYNFYSSNKNLEKKLFNRNNIDQIIDKKISNLPTLNNDTNNVIEFNDGYSKKNQIDKQRSFWNLLKFQ